MRVLSVIHYPTFGGPHNRNARLAPHLAARGWQTTVVLPLESGNAAERLRDAGVEVVQAPLHRLRASPSPVTQARSWASFPSEVSALRRLIQERGADVVLLNGLVNPHAAIAARLEDVPVVWQLLDTRTPMALRRALMPLVTRLADAVMSTGVDVARVHPGALLLGDRLVPFFPPVETSTFRPDAERRARARAELGVPEGACVVGTVGNLNPQKGHEYLLRASAILRGRGQEVAVHILGAHTPTQAEYEARLHEEARALGLCDVLVFSDPGARVAELLPAFDVFVLASVPRSEGVPTVVLEAMSCGIPVVATDVGAVREVVEDGVTGIVVPPLDPDAIAIAVGKLLADPLLRTRMGSTARARAVERYDAQACADTHVRAFEVAIAHRRLQRASSFEAPAPPPARSFEQATELRDLLVCPCCRGRLNWSPDEAVCAECARRYPVVDAVPVLLADQAAAEHDELDHLHGAHHAHDVAHIEGRDASHHDEAHDHKGQQAAYFDRGEAAEFETSRPHGTPAWHRFLLSEKFRRSVEGLGGGALEGATALTVCGGSGMDAEFLARAGARVIASDLSLGAARRARERAARYGVAIMPIVADVEQLPFRDRSVDLVYVHDGLHHLERPSVGLEEMARVARQAVSVTEPARAVATQLAVRLGWALEREEAGNRVARMTPEGLEADLRAAGLSPVHRERYAMFYRHTPGAVSRALSFPVVFPLARLGWSVANRAAGRWGNKVTLQAVRQDVD
jgi:glycosyltransferase involved in cell wall biosynthesis/uncharacterized protein YbaR (Trm112 family)/SAM-dependent methyltransferase